METFSAVLAICAGNSPVPGEFPVQRPVTRCFDVFFDLHLNKRLSEAGDLIRYRAHYDVTVMENCFITSIMVLNVSRDLMLQLLESGQSCTSFPDISLVVLVMLSEQHVMLSKSLITIKSSNETCFILCIYINTQTDRKTGYWHCVL